MIPHSFRTTVAVSVPVLVHGSYDKHGDFHVEDVLSQHERNRDLMPLLSSADIEGLNDEALAQYPETVHQHSLDSKAEAREA